MNGQPKKTVYLNYKSVYGIETVDEINIENFNNRKEFRNEINRLCKEYRMTGQDVYTSSRSTKEWREKE